MGVPRGVGQISDAPVRRPGLAGKSDPHLRRHARTPASADERPGPRRRNLRRRGHLHDRPRGLQAVSPHQNHLRCVRYFESNFVGFELTLDV